MTFASMFCCDGGARYSENMPNNGNTESISNQLNKEDFEISAVN